MTGPPKNIFPYVLDFCESIAPGSTPIFLPVTADAEDKIVDCIGNVRRRIASEGGEAVLGWKIWEWYGLMIEAEFHMVWRAPDGTLRDVTPNPTPYEQILFLPDPALVYAEAQIDNIRKSLTSDARVTALISLMQEKFHMQNVGDRATRYDDIEYAPEEIERLKTIEKRRMFLQMAIMQTTPGRNELCRCGSGKKYKRCCGSGQ